MFVKLFLIKQVKASKKSLAGAIYKEGKWRVLDNLRMPKLQETFKQLPSCVITPRDSLFCKMFSPLVCCEQEQTFKKLFEETVYKYDKENRRSTDEK